MSRLGAWLAADTTSTKVLEEIRFTRARQIIVHGWTLEHDDEHAAGELAQAAMVYLQTAYRKEFALDDSETTIWWPWDKIMPTALRDKLFAKSKREALVNAAALLVAEIERLDRGKR